jgi:antitoxin component YwqK of YwqJK toxin-antitoxin module
LNGRRDGLFVEFNAMSDTIAVGSYQEGEMEGPWKFISGDMIESGTYNNGLKEGLWKEYYKNGVLAFEGNFISGNADGKHVYYFPDGKIREEQYYVNGFKEKVWKKYNEGGILFLAVSYENDTEVKVNGIKLEIVKKN